MTGWRAAQSASFRGQPIFANRISERHLRKIAAIFRKSSAWRGNRKGNCKSKNFARPSGAAPPGPRFPFPPCGAQNTPHPIFLLLYLPVVVVLTTLKYKSKDNNKGFRRENA
jgi:hypothetical protein